MSLGGDNHSTTISFRHAVVGLSWDKVFAQKKKRDHCGPQCSLKMCESSLSVTVTAIVTWKPHNWV